MIWCCVITDPVCFPRTLTSTRTAVLRIVARTTGLDFAEAGSHPDQRLKRMDAERSPIQSHTVLLSSGYQRVGREA